MTDAPSGYRLETAIACFQAARARAEQSGDDEALAALGEATDDARELLARVLRAVVDAEDMEKAAKARAATIAARAARYEARADSLRGTGLAMMQALGETTLRLPDLTASLTAPKRRVIVTDVDVLPDEYVQLERVARKAEIAGDMRMGVVIDGAEWSNGLPSIRILTK